jgi:hypothetical protein
MELLENNTTTQEVQTIQPAINSLAVLDEHEIALVELASKYKGLSIKNIDDKDGYKAVKEARLIMKKARTKIESVAKDLREDAVKFQKMVIERKDELIAIIQPVEEELHATEKRIDEEKEQIRIAEQKQEDARIQSRIDQMAKFKHGIDLYDAKTMPEENFQALLGHAEAEFNKEQERIAEEKAKAEQERLAELERLRLQKEELDRQQAEFNKREAELKVIRDRELAEQRQREADIKAEQDRKDAELKAEREKLETEKRAIALEKLKTETAERERVVAVSNARREILKSYGFEYPFNDLGVMPDAQYKLMEEEHRNAHQLRLQEEQKQRDILAEQERQRQEGLKPDKQKLFEFGDRLKSYILDYAVDFNDKAAADLFVNVKAEFIEAVGEFGHEINKL